MKLRRKEIESYTTLKEVIDNWPALIESLEVFVQEFDLICKTDFADIKLKAKPICDAALNADKYSKSHEKAKKIGELALSVQNFEPYSNHVYGVVCQMISDEWSKLVRVYPVSKHS